MSEIVPVAPIITGITFVFIIIIISSSSISSSSNGSSSSSSSSSSSIYTRCTILAELEFWKQQSHYRG